jgi:cysteine synthase
VSKKWFADNSLSIGRTPLVRLNRIVGNNHATVLAKIEGRNPAYSVKCRIGAAMIWDAEQRGLLGPGKELVEPTSGNTGIALAFVAAAKGIPLTLTMPETMSLERRKLLLAYGANLVLTEGTKGMTGAVAKAEEIAASNPDRYVLLQQFRNAANPRIHEETTGPEIWAQTQGRITHFVSAMGTTGTITGVSQFLKEKNPAVQIVGAQPSEGSRIPGIRKWPQEYLPKIYNPANVDELIYVSQDDAEDTCRQMAREEGLFAGVSAAGACWVAQQIAAREKNATIVFIVCDRGDRYLSTGVFPA